MSAPVQVGVIGAGLMGAIHIRTIGASVARARVVAVSDAIAASAQRIAGELGLPSVHADPLDLIRDPDVHAVVIASPAETHEAFVLACLAAGKPVLCEKPLAATVAASGRVVEAEVALGRRLVQVGFMRRFDRGFLEMKRRLDAGLIGSPLLVHCAHRNTHAPVPFSSEMLLTESLVHEVDAVRWLLDEEIVRASVYAPRSTRHAPDGLRDPQLVVLETEAGVLVDVEVFVNARYGYEVRCELVGESGTLTLAPPASVSVRREGADAARVPEGFQERFALAYVHELQSWVDALASELVGGPSAWDGHAAAAVSEACVRSLVGGGTPAQVSRLEARPDLYVMGVTSVRASLHGS